MSAGFLHAVVCSPLQHMFPSARDPLRCLSAILGDQSLNESENRQFWLGFQPYLFWQLAFLNCH
jgi:hypothetical protein